MLILIRSNSVNVFQTKSKKMHLNWPAVLWIFAKTSQKKQSGRRGVLKWKLMQERLMK